MDTTKSKFYFSVFYKGADEKILPKVCAKEGYTCLKAIPHSDWDECYGTVEVLAENSYVASGLMEKWFQKDKNLTAYTPSIKNKS